MRGRRIPIPATSDVLFRFRSLAAPALVLIAAAGTAWSLTPQAGLHAAEPALRSCLDDALERHPGILAARAEAAAARERQVHATALDDPVLNLTRSIRAVETRVGPQTGGFTLTQSLPWFGTRELRGRLAGSEADALSRLAEAAEREVVARARRAFYDLGYVDAARRLIEEERQLVGHYETLARVRYSTGEGLQQAVLRLQAELTRIRDRDHQLERQRRILVVRLNTACGRSPDEEVSTLPALTHPAMRLDPDRLIARGDRRQPDLRAAASLIEAGDQAVELAGTSFRPRLTASLAWMNVAGRDPLEAPGPLPSDEGKNALGLSLGFTLPVWKATYRSRVEEARLRRAASRQRFEEERDAMEEAVHDAVIRIETLNEQIALLDDVLIPQAEEALRATETAYETAQVGVLDLLDGERVQLDIRRMRARYVSDVLIALADLERSIGAAVPMEGRNGS